MNRADNIIHRIALLESEELQVNALSLVKQRELTMTVYPDPSLGLVDSIAKESGEKWARLLIEQDPYKDRPVWIWKADIALHIEVARSKQAEQIFEEPSSIAAKVSRLSAMETDESAGMKALLDDLGVRGRHLTVVPTGGGVGGKSLEDPWPEDLATHYALRRIAGRRKAILILRDPASEEPAFLVHPNGKDIYSVGADYIGVGGGMSYNWMDNPHHPDA